MGGRVPALCPGGCPIFKAKSPRPPSRPPNATCAIGGNFIIPGRAALEHETEIGRGKSAKIREDRSHAGVIDAEPLGKCRRVLIDR